MHTSKLLMGCFIGATTVEMVSLYGVMQKMHPILVFSTQKSFFSPLSISIYLLGCESGRSDVTDEEAPLCSGFIVKKCALKIDGSHFCVLCPLLLFLSLSHHYFPTTLPLDLQT